MAAYIARRLAQSAAVLLGVVFVVFFMAHLLPGGARSLIGAQASPVVVKQFYAANGYDKPLWAQFLLYLWHLLQGNLGYSYAYNASVASLLA